VDPLTVILVLLAVAFAGGTAVLTARSSRGGSGASVRARSLMATVGAGNRHVEPVGRDQAVGAPPVTSVVLTPSSPPRVRIPESERLPAENGLAEVAAGGVDVADRLERIEDRLTGIERGLVERLEVLRVETRAGREQLGSTLATVDARQVTVFERLRADLASNLSGGGSSLNDGGLRERRTEATMDLYANVARLESSLAQVTNPILLPGEAYAPPVELPPESFAWENWKDVGERAFALADGFSVQRLCLTDPTRQELSAFITMLRGALTRAIYPNLVPDPTPRQLEALAGALGSLASELPRARRALEAEFRALGDNSGGDGSRTNSTN
jgi:hypothetical protein